MIIISIAHIATGLALVGFCISCITRIFINKYKRDAKMVKVARTAHQACVAEVLEEGFTLKTDDLKKDQRFALAKQRATARLAKANQIYTIAKIITVLVGGVAVISIIANSIENLSLKRENKELNKEVKAMTDELGEAVAGMKVAKAHLENAKRNGQDKAAVEAAWKALEESIKLVESRKASRRLSPDEQEELEEAQQLRDSVGEQFQKDLNAAVSRASEHFKRGELLRSEGNLSESISEYLEAIKIDKHMKIAYEKLAEVYHQVGKRRENAGDNAGALDSYKSAILYNDADGWLYAAMGHVQLKLGDAANAVVSLEYAVPLVQSLNLKLGRTKDHMIYWIYIDLGKSYLGRDGSGDLDRAEAILSNVITNSPNSVAYATRALVYRKKGRLDLWREDNLKADQLNKKD